MSGHPLQIDELPQRPATQVKNGWAPVVREVQAAGGVAITNHSTVEAVILSVRAYEDLVAAAAQGRERQQQVLDELTIRFRERLTGLQAPDSRERMDALFKSRGKVRYRSRAGTRF